MASSRVLPTNDTISTFGSTGFGRDYTVPGTWEAFTDNDLVTGTLSESMECCADEIPFNLTATIGLGGATTNATYRRQIRLAAGQGRGGTSNAGVVFVTTGDNNSLVFTEAYAEVHDISFKNTANSTAIRYGVRLFGDNTACVGVIVYDSVNTGTNVMQPFNVSNANSRLINCLAKDNEATGINTNSTGTVIYNCTAVGNGTVGISAQSGSPIAINNLSTGNGTADFSGTFGAGTKNNASGDATAPGTDSRVTQTFTFVNAAGDDCHLASNDAGAKGFGFDMSATYDDDIDFQVRSAPWDIGFDETVAAAILLPNGLALTGLGR